MKLFLIAIAVLLVCVTLYLVYQNRASAKIIENVVTAFCIGTVAILATVWFSLARVTKEHEFVSTFIYDKTTKMPFSCDAFPEIAAYSDRGHGIGSIVQTVRDRDPSLFAQLMGERWTNEDIDRGDELYLDVLLRSIFDITAYAFGGNWKERVPSYRLAMRVTATPEEVRKESVIVTLEDFATLFPDNSAVTEIPGIDMTLPPNSKLSGSSDEGRREMIIANPFFRATIALRFAESYAGVAPVIQRLCDLPDEEKDKYWTVSFVVTLSAVFERLKGGHPDMALYEQWVDTTFEQIRNNCDSEARWKSLIETYKLYYGSPPLT